MEPIATHLDDKTTSNPIQTKRKVQENIIAKEKKKVRTENWDWDDCYNLIQIVQKYIYLGSNM